MNLPERKRRILKAIIENYIDTAEPVGSKALAVSFEQPISSATIRNEMSELEEMGLLEKPHVSSGRVPSYSAYRFYVNELMDRYRVTAVEMEQMRRQMELKMREMDNLMSSASKVITEMTGHTAVSIARQTDRDAVKRCELITADGGANYAIVLVTGSSVKNKMVRLTQPLEPSSAAMVATAINLALAENRLDYLLTSMAGRVGMGSAVFELLDKALEFIVQTEEGESRQEVYVEGISRLLRNREYQDMEKVREMLEYISDTERLPNIFAVDPAKMVNIRIGPENDEPSMKDASLVFSTYKIDEHTSGVVGIIAPTRMDYATVCAKLAGFIRAMGGAPPGETPAIRDKND